MERSLLLKPSKEFNRRRINGAPGPRKFQRRTRECSLDSWAAGGTLNARGVSCKPNATVSLFPCLRLPCSPPA